MKYKEFKRKVEWTNDLKMIKKLIKTQEDLIISLHKDLELKRKMFRNLDLLSYTGDIFEEEKYLRESLVTLDNLKRKKEELTLLRGR